MTIDKNKNMTTTRKAWTICNFDVELRNQVAGLAKSNGESIAAFLERILWPEIKKQKNRK